MRLPRRQFHPVPWRLATLGMACFAGSVAPLLGQESGSVMRPENPNWWRLSLEEIRMGDAIEQTTAAPEVPSVSLREAARQNEQRKAGETSLMRKHVRIEEVLKQPTAAPSRSTTDTTREESAATRDTTLRDYTTATVNALARNPAGNTNLFRAMSPTRSIQSRDYSLFNRPGTEPDPAKSDKPTAETFVMPGAATYNVPANPLEVVKVSVPTLSLQPMLPDPELGLPPAMEEGEHSAGDKSAAAKPIEPPLTATTNAAPTQARNPGSTAASDPAKVRNAPAIPKQHGPPPVIQPSSGRNAQGFYEPKSTTDLQFNR